MIKPKFHYNPKTCQYEHAKLRWVDIAYYVGGVVLVSFVFFVGFMALYDRFVETDREVLLRKENNALEKHKVILSENLASVESSLSALQQNDHELSATLFDAFKTEETPSDASADNREILLADASDFSAIVQTLMTKSASLVAANNNDYSLHESLSKKDINSLHSIPTLQPLSTLEVEKVASGFGMRVNPFHKGMYQHPGLDILSPRGTSVVATAAGKITQLKRSELQAGYGNYIEINHGHGFVTRYAHLESIDVRIGQRVDKGAIIGTVGNSGGSIAPHLHYEVIRNGKNIDPVNYLLEGLNSADHQRLVRISKVQNQSLD